MIFFGHLLVGGLLAGALWSVGQWVLAIIWFMLYVAALKKHYGKPWLRRHRGATTIG